MRLLVCLFAALPTASLAAAQATPPPRDAFTSKSAAPRATIRGRITDKSTGRPLAGAVVMVRARSAMSSPTGEGFLAEVDAEGRYEVANILPGSYFVVATSGELSATHLQQMFGSDSPLNPMAPLSLPVVEVTAGEVRENVDIALVRALAIEGRVIDDLGEPLADVEVSAEYPDRNLPAANRARTDDRGAFRVFGLHPGRYRVCAGADSRGPAVSSGDTLGVRFVRTCHPAAVADSSAETLVVKDADAAGIVIQMQRAGTFTVSGRVVNESGALAADAHVTIRRDRGLFGGGTSVHPETRSGAFTARGLTPGDYVITASSGHSSDPGEGARELGFSRVRVEAADLPGVVVATSSGANVAGRIVPDGDVPLPRGRVVVQARPELQQVSLGPPPIAPAREDRTFELRKVIGPHGLMLSGLPQGWVVARVHYKGADITDQSATFVSSSEPNDLQIVVTNRSARLTARAVDDKGQLAAGSVIVLPADPARWKMRITSGATWTEPQKEYLLPGEYLAAALPLADLVMLIQEPERVALVGKVAQRITLAAGEDRLVELRVTPLPER